MSSKDKPKRPPCPLKHPRYYDAKAGLHQVEDLFEGLTPRGFLPRKLPKSED